MRDGGIRREKVRDKGLKCLGECERIWREMLIAGRKDDTGMVLEKKGEN